MEGYGEGKKRRARRKRGAKGLCRRVIELMAPTFDIHDGSNLQFFILKWEDAV